MIDNKFIYFEPFNPNISATDLKLINYKHYVIHMTVYESYLITLAEVLNIH